MWMKEELAHQWLGFSRETITEFYARAGLVLETFLVPFIECCQACGLAAFQGPDDVATAYPTPSARTEASPPAPSGNCIPPAPNSRHTSRNATGFERSRPAVPALWARRWIPRQ